MNSTLPSLTDEGFISNKNIMLGKLFQYFLASNYSQSNTFFGDISSLSYILANNVPDNKMKADIETTLVKLYSRYFDKADFVVTIEDNYTDVAPVYIEGVLVDNGITYTLSKVLSIQGTTILNYENLLDEYYSEVNNEGSYDGF